MAADALDRAFEALADGTRRGVVDLLRKGPRRAGELAAALDVSAPALTRHLRVLRDCGLVEEGGDDADARVSVYRLRRAPFAQLERWIDDVQALWTTQLEAFAAHVRKRTKGKP
jgi:DNA-binding transcriptional ArsR family regulator